LPKHSLVREIPVAELNEEPDSRPLNTKDVEGSVFSSRACSSPGIYGPKSGCGFEPQTSSSRWALKSPVLTRMVVAVFMLGWCGGFGYNWSLDGPKVGDATEKTDIGAIVEQIIKIESDGDPDAKNKRSSATGLGQFIDETWLRLIRTHRPDLFTGRSEGAVLELRRDAKIAREITARFTEQNAEMLRRRGLPITPGTLYLGHFAGGAGAVAILSALDQKDAASIMASADVTGRTSRERLIKANPFLERLTVADLKSWADRKMRLAAHSMRFRDEIDIARQ
jgi:hypothetical protein